MNKIGLNKPVLVNKMYAVFFDSDNKFLFKNKRDAADFIVKVGREIDQAVLFITEEFNALEEFYRLYYLADTDYKFKYLMDNSVDLISNRLAWMQSHSGSPNHDTILFNAIIICIDELHDGFSLMLDKANKRRDIITKRRCALKMHLIEIYKKSFMSSGIKPSEVNLMLKKSM
jgi:hypothetical protein